MSAETFKETLELQRVFNATIERVFDAWTQPKLLAQWFGPTGFKVISAEADCRPGGKYRISILSPNNETVCHFGEYIEIDKPHTLIFTWILDNQPCKGSLEKSATTLVEIYFKSQGEKTLLTLKHEKLPNQNAFDGHHFGWSGCLDTLENLLNF